MCLFLHLHCLLHTTTANNSPTAAALCLIIFTILLLDDAKQIHVMQSNITLGTSSQQCCWNPICFLQLLLATKLPCICRALRLFRFVKHSSTTSSTVSLLCNNKMDVKTSRSENCDNNVMFSEWCCCFNRNEHRNQFMKGCDSMKLESIKKHKLSRQYKDSVAASVYKISLNQKVR